MDIDHVLQKIKKDYENAITTAKFNGAKYSNGNKAKEALIRSQKLINYIHDYIKQDFINLGINSKKIYPPHKKTKPELKIKGFLKKKNQDISVVPNINHFKNNKNIEKILTVNVRSQLSSLSKNIDTLYERTFAEALNLHLQYEKQCLGEVYLIPTHEYDDQAMKANNIKFKKISKIEEYIKMFQAINNRLDYKIDDYKYERVCLLVADFRPKNPILYSNVKQLIRDGLITKNSKVSMDKLDLNNFVKDILKVYKKRFDVKELT